MIPAMIIMIAIILIYIVDYYTGLVPLIKILFNIVNKNQYIAQHLNYYQILIL